MDTYEIERGVCWVSMGRTGFGVGKRGTKSTVPPSSLFVDNTLDRRSLWRLFVRCRHRLSTLSTREHISLPQVLPRWWRVLHEIRGVIKTSLYICSLFANGRRCSILETILFAKYAELHTMIPSNYFTSSCRTYAIPCSPLRLWSVSLRPRCPSESSNLHGRRLLHFTLLASKAGWSKLTRTPDLAIPQASSCWGLGQLAPVRFSPEGSQSPTGHMARWKDFMEICRHCAMSRLPPWFLSKDFRGHADDCWYPLLGAKVLQSYIPRNLVHSGACPVCCFKKS